MWKLAFAVLLGVVCGAAAQEGEGCNHDGVPGTCTLLQRCEAAKSSRVQWWKLHRCGFIGMEPIVCCVPVATTTTTAPITSTRRPVAITPWVGPRSAARCVLPEFPRNGFYTVAGDPSAGPGQARDAVLLTAACRPGYSVLGDSHYYCFYGQWYGQMPQCSPFCKLTRHPSVTYFCKVTDPNIVGKRRCNEYEPAGMVVQPECNPPNYYHSGILQDMLCVDGSWDYVAVCEPECGTTIPKSTQLMLNGTNAERGELPWHAGVYDTTITPFMQICGGSLISTTIVISAAHCFWRDVSGLRPPGHFAVAVGKLYRPWNNTRDQEAQKSFVSVIRIPPHYSGVAANYQADIALVVLATPVVLTVFIRPVCVNFDYVFDSEQLQSGNMGKVAGWGLTAEDGVASQVLKTTEMPYVDLRQCMADMPFDFLPQITVDKICAGTLNGTALCPGDSGGGLAFPAVEKRTQRYYLRGIVSSARASTGTLKCNANSYTTFTRLQSHEVFIEQSSSSTCILPEYPQHGSYAVSNAPSARPGNTLDFVNLTVSCQRGYEVYGGNPGICSYGRWLTPVSQCISESCTQDGVLGTCRVLSQCQHVVNNPNSHWWNLNRCGSHGIEPIVCCVGPATTTTTTTTTQIPVATTPPQGTTTTEYTPPVYEYVDNVTNVASCPALPANLTAEKTGGKAWDKCVEYQQEVVFPCERGRRGNYCKHAAIELEGGGTDPHQDEFPHMVLLGCEYSKGRVFWGMGGTLISNRFILTSASVKLLNNSASFALVGSLERPEGMPSQGLYRIKRFILHPEYSDSSFYNDIALLETELPMTVSPRPTDVFFIALTKCLQSGDVYTTSNFIPTDFGPGITPVWREISLLSLFSNTLTGPLVTNLPCPIRMTLGQSVVPACLDVFGGDRATAVATGYGTTTYQDETNILQKVTLTSFKEEECKAMIPRDRFLGNGINSTTQLCYGDYTSRASTCMSDTGGPLTIRNPRLSCMYSVVGVISYKGLGCEESRKPKVFTRVEPYVPWIESVVWP